MSTYYAACSLLTTGGSLVSVLLDTDAVSDSFSLLLGVVGGMRGRLLLLCFLLFSATRDFVSSLTELDIDWSSVCVPLCCFASVAAILAGSDFDVRIVELLLADDVADASTLLFNLLLCNGGNDLVPPLVCNCINFFCFHQGSSHSCSLRTISPGILCLSQ